MKAMRLLFQGKAWKRLQPTACDAGATLFKEALWHSDSVVVFVFGNSSLEKDSSCISELQAWLPKAQFFGASSHGVIDGDEVMDSHVSAVVIAFENSHIKLVSQKFSSATQVQQVTSALAASLISHAPEEAGPLVASIVLADGLGARGGDLQKGLRSELRDIPIVGGMSADGTEFKTTWVLHEGKPTKNAVAVLGLYGNKLRFGFGSDSGPIPFGPIRRVTESIGHELLSLDGRPALEVYRDYLGSYAGQLPGSAALFPLGLRRQNPADGFVIRSVLGIDEERKSLRMAGEVALGQPVQLMRASQDQLIDAAVSAGSQVSSGLAETASGSDIYSLVVSCFGRRVLLGSRTGEDLESILSELPPGVFQSGFFSYGEFGALKSGESEFHNMTLCVTAITEDV